MSRQLLDRINEIETKLAAVSKWNGSGCAFGHVDNKISDDYIFEFFCYISTLNDLKSFHKICFISGRKKVFPKKPARKSQGWARFDIFDKEGLKRLFQVCAGTGIQLSCCPGTILHPDISFQFDDAPEDGNPKEKDVQFVMDAKYKANNQKTLDLGTINAFIGIVAALKLGNGGTSSELEFQDLKSFNGNCLITNGKTQDKHKQFCESMGIRQIGKFGTDEALEVVGRPVEADEEL